MPRPKPEVEPVQIAVRLSPKLLAELDAECARSEKSRNGIIAHALTRLFDDQAILRHPEGLGEIRQRVVEAIAILDEVEAAGPMAKVPFGPVKREAGSLAKKPKGKAL